MKSDDATTIPLVISSFIVFLAGSLILGSNITLSQTFKGHWVVDVDETLEFNEKKVKMSQDEIQFIDCGRLQSVFTESGLRVYQEEHTCRRNGKTARLKAFSLDFEYRVLGQSQDEIVLETIDQNGVSSYETYHFENDDLFWVYHYFDGDDTHLRVYFRRVE